MSEHTMTPEERFSEIQWRAKDLAKQLDDRAKLYRLMKATEIGDEFERLRRVEVDPIIKLSALGQPQ